MIAWSYGGGVQSVAIGVLIREGVLPRPDLAAIVDTGRERRTTWEYLREHMQPFLGDLVTIQTVPHSLASKDLYGTDGLTLMPAYTDEGRIPGYCSGHWKRDVFERWLRLQGVKDCDMWIGYSIDEVRRVPKKDHRNWCHLAFPLIDRMLNRAMCLRLIEAAGLPRPHKSRCYMCPHQNAEEWAEVRADPEDWALAVEVDRAIRESDPEQRGLYVHSSRVPLDLVDFGADTIETPAKLCDTGHCWT